MRHRPDAARSDGPSIASTRVRSVPARSDLATATMPTITEAVGSKRGSGRGWIRTSEGISHQIYSLTRLATSVHARWVRTVSAAAGRVHKLLAAQAARRSSAPPLPALVAASALRAPCAGRVRERSLGQCAAEHVPLRQEPPVGIEPTTYGLQNRCSTAELWRPFGLPRGPDAASHHPKVPRVGLEPTTSGL